MNQMKSVWFNFQMTNLVCEFLFLLLKCAILLQALCNMRCCVVLSFEGGEAKQAWSFLAASRARRRSVNLLLSLLGSNEEQSHELRYFTLRGFKSQYLGVLIAQTH